MDNLIEGNDMLHLSQQKNGFWLYDNTRGMNLSMRAKSKDQAFIEALTYYQNRLLKVEAKLKDLTSKVDNFVGLFQSEEG